MDLTDSYVIISYLCLISALILLIFPNINYVIKAILTTLVTIFLSYTACCTIVWHIRGFNLWKSRLTYLRSSS